MGCFSVSCGLSGKAMYADDAYLIPLIPGDYSHPDSSKFYEQMKGSNLVSNDGAKQFFVPLTLPICGSIDSYGRLENIIEDDNTKAIEEYFGLKIAEFAEVIAYGESFDKAILKKKPALKHHAGMWVNKTIYDTMVECTPDESGNADNAWESSMMIDEVLELLGFSYQSSRKNENINYDDEKKLSYDEQEKQRYHRMFTHPHFSGVNVYSDERWIRVEFKGEKEAYSAYHPKDLVALIEKKTKKKFAAKYANPLKKRHTYDVLFDAAKKQLDEAKESKRKFSSPDSKLPESFFLYGHEELRTVFNLWEYSNSDGIEYFLRLYGKNLEGVRTQVVRQKTFDFVMYNCNRLYLPTTCGPQMGNHYAERKLHETALKVVNEEIAEHEKNMGE